MPVCGCVLNLFVNPFRYVCSATAQQQAMGPPLKQDDLDSRLERDVVSAVLHLREHGWAVINDVITRCAFLKDYNGFSTI